MKYMTLVERAQNSCSAKKKKLKSWVNKAIFCLELRLSETRVYSIWIGF